jgi:hypothetical protein
MPNNTKDKEKNALIARTAATNSVALASIYEYHFQAVGTKKCHTPKPMEAVLPVITNILTSKFIITSPGNSKKCLAAGLGRLDYTSALEPVAKYSSFAPITSFIRPLAKVS